jgi:hypothetical protein
VRLGRAYGLSGRHRDAVALLEAASQMDEILSIAQQLGMRPCAAVDMARQMNLAL